ncbi:MAG: aminodeoxychorismate synthase component I, partial [Pseudomonadota bacterium]
TSKIYSNLSKSQYFQAFNKIKSYIAAGDCYQVNLAQRFYAEVQGDSWQAYKKLREISPAPFMAYMNLPLNETEHFQVLSNSPERFLQTDSNHVETRPIKGTRPRSADPEQDLAYSNELLTSLKDRAENVMIVDLLRNDIGKNCSIGSVKADKLFQLQSFANVHHLVSIVTGKLKQTATAVDLLKGCFPGGSITGAPKLRAMQIIEELEPHQRGLYCGAIGYIGFDGKMDTNIAIRTAIICKNVFSFYAGGGIVADSVADKEYDETLDKASKLKALLEHFSTTHTD